MKTRIELNNELLSKAKQISDDSIAVIVERALKLFVEVNSQKGETLSLDNIQEDNKSFK